jgi:3-hydroxyisobutyrate dehydrogenase-like beta-hydroxyacid dehydrogenase
VVTTVTGRSDRTRRLAHGLELLPELALVVAESDLVVSVCPPGAAADVLDAVLAVGGDSGLFVDLNAISPDRCNQLAGRCSAAGWDFVDGSISGGPPSSTSSAPTRVYLSGSRAEEVASLRATGLSAQLVGSTPGIASAIKMCTAAVYKGTTALWLQALGTADYHHVLEPVIEDLSASFPDLAKDLAPMLALAASKSARYVDEMESIAATQAMAGLGPELFGAMAQVFERLAMTPLAAMSPEDARTMVDVREVLGKLRSG